MKDLYTTPEVARRLKLTPQHISWLCRKHGIGFKTPRAYILTKEDIEELKKRKKLPGPARKEADA